MKNIQLFKHIAAGLLLSGSLIGTSCSSDYMDTIPTENVSFTTVSTSLDNLYLALNLLRSLDNSSLRNLDAKSACPMSNHQLTLLDR